MTTAHQQMSASSYLNTHDSNSETVGLSSVNIMPPPSIIHHNNTSSHVASPRQQSLVNANRIRGDSLNLTRDRSASYGSHGHYSSIINLPPPPPSNHTTAWSPQPSPRGSTAVPAFPPLSPVPPFYTGDEDIASSSSTHHRMTTPVPFLESSATASTSFPSPTNSHMAMKQAVESALSTERSRIRTLEEAEASLSLEELRHVLKRERLHSLHLTGELAAIKSALVTCQAEAEIHEEGRINTLMRRVHNQMESMQREKERIIVELEREEEMLTNTLQKKLEEVRREKEILQRKIEQEHLFNEELRAKVDSLSESSSTITSCLEDSHMMITPSHDTHHHKTAMRRNKENDTDTIME